MAGGNCIFVDSKRTERIVPMNLTSMNKQKFIKTAVMAACFSMIFVCLGFCSSNKSVYLSAITEALGIKRSIFSINDSCRYIATAVVNLFFGALIMRFGAKKLVGAGFFCLIVAGQVEIGVVGKSDGSFLVCGCLVVDHERVVNYRVTHGGLKLAGESALAVGGCV